MTAASRKSPLGRLTGLAASVAGVVVVTAVMTGSLMLANTGGRTPVVVAGSVALLLAPMVAMIVLFAGAARGSHSHEPRLWASAALASIALLVGELCDLAWRLWPNAHDHTLLIIQIGAFVLAALVGVASVWRFTGQSFSGQVLDMLTLFLATGVLVVILVLPTFRGEQIATVRALAYAAFPCLSLTLLEYVILHKRSRWERWQVLLTAWLATIGAGYIASAAIPLAERSALPGAWPMLVPDALFMMAHSFGAAAALVRMYGTDVPTRRNEHERFWPILVAPVALMAIGPLTYVQLTTRAWSQSDIWIVVVVGVMIGLTTTLRSHLIAAENAALQERSTIDVLTELSNHRRFHSDLDAEIGRSLRTESPLSVAAIDLDDFDRVNNIHGHQTGDRRLRSIARALKTASRATDIVCRVGGDEFAIIMPGTDPMEACKVCLRLQEEVRAIEDGCALKTGLSVGIASLPHHATSHEELLDHADGALYWAKFHGREQVVIYDSGLVGLLGPEERVARLEEESYLNMVQVLSAAVDARDQHTQRHSRRVAEFAVALGMDLGMSDQGLSALETAALLHDVGKIGVPDSVLRKAESLDQKERVLVEEHPILASRILSALPDSEILPWIEAHHERWDGKGYPRGLIGEQIPPEARIIALCDALDAITSIRPYRAQLSGEQARAEIMRNAGTQFDPRLAERLVALLERMETSGRHW